MLFQIPQPYLASNWPIRYSALSSDGRLVAVAGRRGLIHYSSTSGRWKLFSSPPQEQAFVVKGGLLWFHHVLVAAVEVSKSYQVRAGPIMSRALLTLETDSFIFPGLRAEQSKCSPSGDNIVSRHHSISGGQFAVGLHCGQHAEPLFNYSDCGFDQVAHVWEYHFQRDNRCAFCS